MDSEGNPGMDTEGAGGNMVFVKVRETYDLHTLRNKMTVIGVHTPDHKIIRATYPGLLMQCKGYRPVSCDVRLACASVLPLDPKGVGTTEGDVAPEDIFNPILYKAVSNKSMSQLELYINYSLDPTTVGSSLNVDSDGLGEDDFNLYYGLLSDTHGWKHANPQSGLSMKGLKPVVYEMNYTVGQNSVSDGIPQKDGGPGETIPGSSTVFGTSVKGFLGKAKSMPMLWTTGVRGYATGQGAQTPVLDSNSNPMNYHDMPGGTAVTFPSVGQLDVPSPKIYVGALIVPPSRLHQLFYRMVVEWTLEFTSIRGMQELTTWNGLVGFSYLTYHRDYDFSARSLSSKTTMVDTTEGTEIQKVM